MSKKSPIILALTCLLLGSLGFMKEKEIPRGPDGATVLYQGIPVFIMTKPVTPYTLVAEVRPIKIEDSRSFVYQITASIDEVIAKKNKGRFDEFNGVVVSGRMKKFAYIKLEGSSPSENALCNPYAYQKSKKYTAKWVYFAATPVKAFTELQSFDRGVLGQMGFGTANNAGDPAVVMINSFGEKAERIAKDEGIEFDGIIVKQNKESIDQLVGNEFGEDIVMFKWN